MSRPVASVILLLAFPAFFVGAAAGLEFALHALYPDVRPHYTGGERTVVWFAVGVGVLPFAFGLFDVCEVNGVTSRYREGMEGHLPTGDPYGYVLLRLRRYMLVPIVTMATFVAIYCLNKRPEPDVTRRPYVWPALVAFLLARRPLNSTPLGALKAAKELLGDGMKNFSRGGSSGH